MTLGERTKRIALIPVIILAGALSWWQELLRGAGVLRMKDDVWGWLRPDMEQHWARFFAGPSYHTLKNIGAEWADGISQRPYKALSWLAVMTFVVGLCLGTLVGLAF